MLGCRVRQQNFINLAAMRAALVNEWNNEDMQGRIRTLIASMPDRMQAVITARGGNTRY